MPDSQELDDILNEIKGFRDKSNEEKKSETPLSQKPDKVAEAAGEAVKSESEKENKEDLNNNQNASDNTKAKSEKTLPSKKESEDISFASFEKLGSEGENNYREDKKVSDNKKGSNGGKGGKKPIIIGVIAVLVVAIVAAVAFALTRGNGDEETTAPTESTTIAETTAAPVSSENPLTGESDFNADAVGKRPVACVVENAAAARPQWGIDDSDNPPDIILEGEVEGGETRMLWFYADYTSVPSQIGPTRSARPPFIKFSELYDSIFIHWGMSKTKRGTAYIGANTVFREDNVDHIDQMTYGGGVALFGRDGSRGVSTEHTGVIYGEKLAEAIEGEGFRTDADSSKYTKLSFAKDVSFSTQCSSLAVTFSSRTATRDWSYNEEDGMYHSSDYSTDVARENLLVLFDSTEYVAKANYKNSGSAEIYCNYKLAGGEGKLACNGTVEDITWSVENGVLVIKNSAGEDVSLSVGTTWIGWASANNGGLVS